MAEKESGQQSRPEAIYIQHRLILNNQLKRWLFNNSLADMGLYAGEYCPTTLGTVRAGLGTIAKSTPTARPATLSSLQPRQQHHVHVLEQMETASEKNLRNFAWGVPYKHAPVLHDLEPDDAVASKRRDADRRGGRSTSDDDAALPCAIALDGYIKRRGNGPDAAAFVRDPWLMRSMIRTTC